MDTFVIFVDAETGEEAALRVGAITMIVPHDTSSTNVLLTDEQGIRVAGDLATVLNMVAEALDPFPEGFDASQAVN